ncbi:hypothetical protein KUL72_04395 [Bradyrhizobium arachidis]|uniref:hypothetical protein n=1 Tax=Bradyrhizobium arachidis TaxID=858423 RepID=UPI002163B4D3|nr:hypothetical protein [Bradyrhizobium arachidis]UVO37637.1 hypothetical protein KUL72_04395 [Bradyrhizobium arachidis]
MLANLPKHIVRPLLHCIEAINRCWPPQSPSCAKEKEVVFLYLNRAIMAERFRKDNGELMMRAFVVGALLSIVGTSSLLAANFTPSPAAHAPHSFSQITCDQKAASVCQQQANGCGNICKASTDYQSCWQGCLNRYKECKYNAGCGGL